MKMCLMIGLVQNLILQNKHQIKLILVHKCVACICANETKVSQLANVFNSSVW